MTTAGGTPSGAAAKVQAADERVDLADGRLAFAEALGEVEPRFAAHQHFRAQAAGIGGRKQENAGKSRKGQALLC